MSVSTCRICGDALDPRRVELGYDYCLKQDCQDLCVKGIELASVGVNKAADYYMGADEVAAPRPPKPSGGGPDEPDDEPRIAPRDTPPTSPRGAKRRTTLQRLRDAERELDRALERSYERFDHGEITATEMGRECDRLTAAFNRTVRAENIRFRSMLRGRHAPRR